MLGEFHLNDFERRFFLSKTLQLVDKLVQKRKSYESHRLETCSNSPTEPSSFRSVASLSDFLFACHWDVCIRLSWVLAVMCSIVSQPLGLGPLKSTSFEWKTRSPWRQCSMPLLKHGEGDEHQGRTLRGQKWRWAKYGKIVRWVTCLKCFRECQAPNIGYASRSWQVASSLMKPPSYTVITPLEANHPNHVISHTHTKV